MIKHIHKAKHHVRKHLAKPHHYFYENFVWYKWWHKQDYHQHVHYAAMVTGMIAAVYFVMIETIMKTVTF